MKWFKKAYNVDHEDVPTLYKLYMRYYRETKKAGWDPEPYETWVHINKFRLKRMKLIETD